ncbi:uncharacterized protein LOC119546711 [Drosophila subpulchrella]|uniref:uncharacterized protein LOC119546711 n=1 Tax=Drosophila subpulchrella TaxID=1486046 RepID=UPI0018A19ED9|nr:uncharacterized protein LOC119546711 [Drosophila subpulchrella]
MNSCCCRSHSDRTDPMSCLPQFPRLQRVQSCRPFLEGRKAASCCISSERRWGQRNGGMINLLANMVGKSTSTVCQFLHQLTLQLFAKILYPLMLGWNTLKIPFVLPDTCELYYGIFDECGNLRKPIPTRTLVILISMMQYFLNLPKGGRRCNKCPGCRNKEDDLKNIHNPGYCGKDAMIPFSEHNVIAGKAKSPASEVWAGLRRLGYERRGDLESYPSDESIPYGYAPARCPCQSGYYNDQRPGRVLTNPYANMSTEMKTLACEEELQSPMLAPDCIPSSPVANLSPKAAQLYHITHISDLYAAVVQNQHSRRLLGDGKPPKPRVRPCTENRRRFSGGFMMPEPYFNGMPWSWLHRDPQRMVRLPSGGLPLEIPRYRRQPLDAIQYKYENLNRQVSPFKESSLLPIESFPQKRLQPISWEKNNMDLEKLPIKLPFKEKRKLEWEELLLRRVNEARKAKGAFDYWREMMERNQLRKTFDQGAKDMLTIRNPIFPIRRERSYSPAGKEISRMIKDRSNNSLRATSKKQKNSSENKKGATPKRAYRKLNNGDRIKPIYSGQDDQLVKVPIKLAKPRDTNNKSVDYVLGSAKVRKNSKHTYPDPEDYRREMSRNRRYQRKTAGECLMLIKPVESIKQKHVNIPAEGPNEKIKLRSTSPKRFFPPGGGDQIPKQNIKLQEEIPKPMGLFKGKDNTKIIFKPRVAKSPERTIRKIRFQANGFTEPPSNSKRAKLDSPERIKRHKSHGAVPSPLKIYYENSKMKTNKFLDKSCNIRTKISHSRGETTDVGELSNRRKRRKSLGYML